MPPVKNLRFTAVRRVVFLFTQHVPDESEIGRYYESPDYISHTDTRKGLANRLYHYVRGFSWDARLR